jgi:hypothetical protein
MARMRQTAAALREWRRQFDFLPAPAVPLVVPAARRNWRIGLAAAAAVLAAASVYFAVVPGRPATAAAMPAELAWVMQTPPWQPAGAAAAELPIGNSDAGFGRGGGSESLAKGNEGGAGFGAPVPATAAPAPGAVPSVPAAAPEPAAPPSPVSPRQDGAMPPRPATGPVECKIASAPPAAGDGQPRAADRAGTRGGPPELAKGGLIDRAAAGAPPAQVPAEAFVRQFDFRFGVPPELPGGWQFVRGRPVDSRRVQLIYEKEGRVVTASLSPTAKGDEPMHVLQVGGRTLAVGRRGGLAVAVEGGSAGAEIWQQVADRFAKK